VLETKRRKHTNTSERDREGENDVSNPSTRGGKMVLVAWIWTKGKYPKNLIPPKMRRFLIEVGDRGGKKTLIHTQRFRTRRYDQQATVTNWTKIRQQKKGPGGGEGDWFKGPKRTRERSPKEGRKRRWSIREKISGVKTFAGSLLGVSVLLLGVKVGGSVNGGEGDEIQAEERKRYIRTKRPVLKGARNRVGAQQYAGKSEGGKNT